MKILERIGLSINFAIALTGIEYGLLSQPNILSKLDVRELEKISVAQLQALYSNEWTNEQFRDFLTQIGKIDESRRSAALKIWQFALLNDIIDGNDQTEVKLDKVASLWAFFDYTPNWTNLINYMPPQNGVTAGVEPLYERILTYVKGGKTNLSRYQQESGLP